MYKLIWLLPISIVSIIIVLINEAAAVFFLQALFILLLPLSFKSAGFVLLLQLIRQNH